MTGHRRRTAALGAGVGTVLTAVLATAAGPVERPIDTAALAAGASVAAEPVTARSGFADSEWGDDDTREDEAASAATGSWRADQDMGSMYTSAKLYGAHQAWTQNAPDGRKLTGAGVTVAVIDTGVAPVEGLDAPGKVVNGPDLSFESQAANTRYLDGFGHGTHMAAIIAGRDPEVRAGNEHDARNFVGVAPDARVLNMKVGTADGGADVTQVIAAIDWVVEHRNDNGLNVRVINLSYGVPSTQSYLVDPLALAVENAWRAGIVVVAAAGNDGGGQALTMPAADPYVIAVGAVDHHGSFNFEDHDVAAFTNDGVWQRRPDLIAPGKSIVSLRVPGSTADRGHPEGLVTGDSEKRFFRGSGTSQATAVVSGAAALLLQQRPSLTPDQVKYLLKRSAERLEENGDPTQGAGYLDVKQALETPTVAASTARQAWTRSSGLGTLAAARGGSAVVDPDNGVPLTGEVDALGTPWDARRWSSASTTGTAWSGGTWNARRWSGDSWSGDSWAAGTWSGRSWSGADWSARRWSSDVWSARRWSGSDWSARRWSGEAWSARRWSGESYATDSAW